ncbi:histidine--tRNA ligase [Candidatus Clavichlamydia salmonicola]|uniref:histidine--tRNA ligase n=1 Tax=Candidatus Clavichlamydia salmonicola TaxID=469812 RepID=UPI0018911654|nr:histidine--tRNA ligase [Candidatus Clavichlamydia salmonicola]
MRYNSAKGVFDILPYQGSKSSEDFWKSMHLWTFVEKAARDVATLYGFSEIRTPMFEDSGLFRSAGDLSDLVKKEMYTFQDKKGRSLTLRPEGTAPVARALVQHGLHTQRIENKLFYVEPMFRYERQQVGRYRQHHQFGIESIGIKNPYVDAEVIFLMNDFLNKMGINKAVIHVNCLGDADDRKIYEEALKAFFKKDFKSLSPLSQERYQVNPLRILDSNEEQDKILLKAAPKLIDFVKEESLIYFEKVCQLLQEHAISYKKDPFLVRGLDYYTDFVFEVSCSDAVGRQSALGGGGRYDDLTKSVGGPPLPAAGFGIGLERVIQQFLVQKNIELPAMQASVLWIAPMDEFAIEEGFRLVTSIRKKGISAELTPVTKNLKNIVKEAVLREVSFFAVLGSKEIKDQSLMLKNLKTSTAITCGFNEIRDRISQ